MGSNILASMEEGSFIRVCLVVSNFSPPTLRMTTSFSEGLSCLPAIFSVSNFEIKILFHGRCRYCSDQSWKLLVYDLVLAQVGWSGLKSC